MRKAETGHKHTDRSRFCGVGCCAAPAAVCGDLPQPHTAEPHGEGPQQPVPVQHTVHSAHRTAHLVRSGAAFEEVIDVRADRIRYHVLQQTVIRSLMAVNILCRGVTLAGKVPWPIPPPQNTNPARTCVRVPTAWQYVSPRRFMMSPAPEQQPAHARKSVHKVMFGIK
jgi:hypothetical protein